MRCSVVKKQVVRFFNDRMSLEKKQLIQYHLQNCNDCRNYYNTYQHTEKVLQRIHYRQQHIEEPFWLTEKVLFTLNNTIHSKHQETPVLSIRIITMLTVVAFITTLLLGYFTYSRHVYAVSRADEKNTRVEELMITEMSETYYTNFLAINTPYYANEQ